MNNTRDILPKMSSVSGLSRVNIELANKLAKQLDEQTFRELTTFIAQAESKIELIRNRNSTYGF